MKMLRFHLHLKSWPRQLTLWASMITFCGSQYYGTDQGFGKNFHIASSSKIQSKKVTYPLTRPVPAKNNTTTQFLGSKEDNTSKELMLKQQPAGLSVIPEGQITTPLHLNFEDRVMPHAEEWQETNEEKIIEYVAKMKDLTNGQKFYLATLLLSYSQTLNSSIVYITFDPDGQFFEMITIDTFHHPYNPEVDYSQKQHREISLRTLHARFGFEDLLMSDLRDLPDIQIRNNPDRPKTIFKILPFILAAQAHPERIKIISAGIGDRVGLRLKVYHQNTTYNKLTGLPYVPELTELIAGDFLWSDIEQLFMMINEKRLMEKLSMYLSQVSYELYLSLHPDHGKEWIPEWQIFKRARFREIHNALLKAEDSIFSFRFSFKHSPERFILDARKELRYLDEQQVTDLILRFGGLLDTAADVLKRVEELFTRYPDLRERRFSPNDGTAAEVLENAKQIHKALITIQQEIIRKGKETFGTGRIDQINAIEPIHIHPVQVTDTPTPYVELVMESSL